MAELWYPKAKTNYKRAKGRGAYPKGYPQGAIVHFTAGRRNGLDNCVEYQLHEGYLFFCIDQHGNVSQNFPLNEWGWHAGKSSWPTLDGNVSNDLVGIEVMCAGRLRKKDDGTYQTWFKIEVPPDEVRTVGWKDNMEGGPYQKYTEAQEKALIDLLRWLHNNNPEVFSYDLVLGHDEVAPGRKNDPGGSLSVTMPEFRELLRSMDAKADPSTAPTIKLMLTPTTPDQKTLRDQLLPDGWEDMTKEELETEIKEYIVENDLLLSLFAVEVSVDR